MDFISTLSGKILPACGEGDRAQRGGGGFGFGAVVVRFPKCASGLTPPPSAFQADTSPRVGRIYG